MAINLKSYVINPWTKKADIDWKALFSDAAMGLRFLDDMIDLEVEKIDLILAKIEADPMSGSLKQVELDVWKRVKQTALDWRRTGLGVTAEGDMLAMLGVQYGSEFAIQVSEIVHRYVIGASYKESIRLAEERGAFLEYHCKYDMQVPMLGRLFSEEKTGCLEMSDFWKYEQFGRRNVATTTIAPVGSGSTLTQTTSGVEPLFLPFYKRRMKSDVADEITFTDGEGQGWAEFFVLHKGFEEWIEFNNYTYESNEDLQELFEKSPYKGSTANDIDYIAKVKMQGRIQRWVDHSISCTVNMNKDVTPKDVKAVYEEAWRSGCKGVTVYRDGSRSGVLVSSKEENLDESPVIRKRPKTLECDIHSTIIGGKNWKVIIGLLDDKPYEVFAYPQSLVTFPSDITKGWITKVSEDGNKRYMLTSTDEKHSVGDLCGTQGEIATAVCLPIAALLAMTGNVEYSVKILSKMDGNITSFSQGIKRVLIKYIENKDGLICPACGEPSLTMVEGCMKCTSCGESKCG